MLASAGMESSAASGGGGRGRRSAATADRTRQRLIDAALALFAERGFEGVSLRDIAVRAGTTHGLLRHHFGSKTGLWEAVVDEADRRFVARVPDFTDLVATPDPRDAVEMIVESLLDAARRHPAIVLLLLQEGIVGGERLEYVLRQIAPLRSATGALLNRLHAAGRLTALDEDAFFLLVLGAVTLPVALAPLSRAVTGVGATEGRAVDEARHILDLLLP